MHQFQDLLSMVETNPDAFFGFNDFYFMNLLHQSYMSGEVKNPKIREMMKMLLFRESPIEVQLPLFEHRLLNINEDGQHQREMVIKRINEFVAQLEDCLKANGDGTEWILHDIPDSDILFSRPIASIVRKRSSDNLLQERDPVKIMDRQGKVSLLVDKENSIMKILSNVTNFIPVLYMNPKAHALLIEKGLLKA